MNSHRDNVKDAIESTLIESGVIDTDDSNDLKYVLADKVFDALGITGDEQDRTDGYFILHASKDSNGVPMPPPQPDKVLLALKELGGVEDAEILHTVKGELDKGRKYQPWEFKAFAEGRQRFEDNKSVGWYVTLQTPICRYGQSFDDDNLDVCKEKFTNGYYPMYITDYERSQEIAEVDNE